jgi:hypothetical protein
VKTRAPTLLEIEELIAFLPRLYAEGFAPINRWNGGTKDQDGMITMPWPEYNETVLEFVEVASRECWTDPEYLINKARRMLENEYAIEAADLTKIKTMLTFCVRGERFCEGHWGSVIEGGAIRRILQRLAELELISVQPDTPPDSNSADERCS